MSHEETVSILLPEDVPRRWNSVRAPTQTFKEPVGVFSALIKRASKSDFARRGLEEASESAPAAD